MREIRLLRSRWRGLETESRLGLHGHERGNPGYRQGHNLTDYRASPRPYFGIGGAESGLNFLLPAVRPMLYASRARSHVSVCAAEGTEVLEL